MDYVQTPSGKMLNLLEPDPDTITIADIAHALAHICRFNGCIEEHYSVAQHSVLMARHLRDQGREPAIVRTALLHDAHEAYIGDMPSPVKALCYDFQALEVRIWHAVAARFRLPRELPAAVRMADRHMLVTEASQLFPDGMVGPGWPDVGPYPIPIVGWDPVKARHEFLMEADRCTVL